jgi:predicted RNA-binding Zn-ribbon protein involved in translation (DUF1610 family)
MSKPDNSHKKPLRLSHTTLKRASEDSAFRSKCPACLDGVLLVMRDSKSHALINVDTCTSCGQRIIYKDTFINDEPVVDISGRN